MKTRRATTSPRNPVIRALLQNPSRAIRRHEDKRAKAEAQRQLSERRNTSWGVNYPRLTARQIGKAASTHLRACSCFMCQRDGPVNERIEADTALQFETAANVNAMVQAEHAKWLSAMHEEQERNYKEADRRERAYYTTMRLYCGVQEWANTAPDKWVLRQVESVDSDPDYRYDPFNHATIEKAYLTIDRTTDEWVVEIPSFNRDRGRMEFGVTLYPYYEHSLDQMQGLALLLRRLAFDE